MARSNIDAIYAEYPFLSRLIPRRKVSGAQVKRWSSDFLTTTPDSYLDCGTERIYFLDKDGNVVDRVGSFSDRVLGFFGFHTNEETVGQALARIGQAKTRRIRYAVGVWNDMILYKLPKGYDYAGEWLASVVAEGSEEI